MKTQLNIAMRPKSFGEIIGLEEQIGVLENRIKSGSIPRAILLSGQFGTGKTTLAYIIARAIQGSDLLGDPQVQEVNAANLTGVDDMRKLVESAQFRPMTGKHGVIILDEAHRLSKQAQELLLKEFELKDSSTVWIICTTEPGKLEPGIRAGRCFSISTEGLGPDDRMKLVMRAAAELKHEGELTEFLGALTKGRITSPRKILQAFESHHYGLSIADAIGAQSLEGLPDYYDVAFGVIFGAWEQDAPDWRDTTYAKENRAQRRLPPVSKQLDALEKKLAKKNSEENSDDENVSKPEAAKAIRAIVGGFLKGRVLKGGQKAEVAAQALEFLVKAINPNAYELEWATTIGALYRINRKLGA